MLLKQTINQTINQYDHKADHKADHKPDLIKPGLIDDTKPDLIDALRSPAGNPSPGPSHHPGWLSEWF